jgi:hypothetical protein
MKVLFELTMVVDHEDFQGEISFVREVEAEHPDNEDYMEELYGKVHADALDSLDLEKMILTEKILHGTTKTIWKNYKSKDEYRKALSTVTGLDVKTYEELEGDGEYVRIETISGETYLLSLKRLGEDLDD